MYFQLGLSILSMHLLVPQIVSPLPDIPAKRFLEENAIPVWTLPSGYCTIRAQRVFGATKGGLALS